jgi:hypothetical protein
VLIGYTQEIHMRDYPQALIVDSLRQNISEAQATAMAHYCPFCGVRLQRFDHNHQLVESQHPANWCNVANTATYFGAHPSDAYHADQDGDLWLFEGRTEYGETIFYLRPTDHAELRAMIGDSLTYIRTLLDLTQHALDSLPKEH